MLSQMNQLQDHLNVYFFLCRIVLNAIWWSILLLHLFIIHILVHFFSVHYLKENTISVKVGKWKK